MASTNDSGLGHGSNGAPQTSMDEQVYPEKAAESEAVKPQLPVYVPSPKHDPKGGWGSGNPITSQEEGQRLLDTGYRHGRQIYNVTKLGEIIKFQPDGTPQNGYHAYQVYDQENIPIAVMKHFLEEG